MLLWLITFSLQSLHEKNLGTEFQSEVQTLSRVEHLNLVKFYGYLEQGDERIVVVEYVPNGTLREHLDCEFFCPLSYLILLWFATLALALRLKHWLFVPTKSKDRYRHSWKHSGPCCSPRHCN